MQLSDILEEGDVKKINQKTNISRENIERLMSEDFANLSRAKTLGFISILERDYKVDLAVLRDKALAYYEKHGSDEERMVFTVPNSEEKTESTKGNSTFITLVVFGLLAYGIWYYISKYDKEIYSKFTSFLKTQERVEKDLGITTSVTQKRSTTDGVSKNIVLGADSKNENNIDDNN
jgi:hypothetical protein